MMIGKWTKNTNDATDKLADLWVDQYAPSNYV